MKLLMLSYYRFSGCLSILFFFFILTNPSYAKNTFEDPKNKFSIELPEGWKLDPQQDNSTFIFKGNGSSIILQYLADTNDREELFNHAVSTLKDSGMPNASPEEQTKDLSVNGHNARMGLYTDIIKLGSVNVKLYGLIGSVALEKGGLYFISILNKNNLEALREPLERAFNTIQSRYQGAAGATEPAAKVDDMAGQPSIFKNDYLTLTLPSGWISQDIPSNFEKEIVGWLKSSTIAGASITVSCYQGWRYNYSNVRRGGLNTIAAVYPKGQKMLKDKTAIMTDSGQKAIFELWQGIADSSGQTATLQSPMGIVKTQNCWLLMIGYVSDAAGPRLEEDFIKILKSVK